MAAESETVDDGRPEHPLFDRAKQPPGGFIDRIVERRVAEARAAGLFDDLPGSGKPLPDLDRRRRAGWWADQFVRRERHGAAREELLTELRSAMAPMWRLPSEEAVRSRVAELNAKIADYNRVTTVEPADRLDPDVTVATWHRLRSR